MKIAAIQAFCKSEFDCYQMNFIYNGNTLFLSNNVTRSFQIVKENTIWHVQSMFCNIFENETVNNIPEYTW